MRTSICIAFFLTLFTFIGHSQLTPFNWGGSFGTTSTDSADEITTDNDGNVYTIGSFVGTIDLDPGPGVYNMSAGAIAAYVQKLDKFGNFVWAFQLDSWFMVNGVDIAYDPTGPGYIYITGAFADWVDFDPGPGSVWLESTQWSNDIYIAKYDLDANFLWVKQMGGLYEDFPSELGVRPGGAVTISGDIYDIIDFDPDFGVYNIGTANESGSFVASLNSDGSFNWADEFNGDISFNDLIVSNTGDIYLTGDYFNSVDFDPSAGSNIQTASTSEYFVLKLNIAGLQSWANVFPSSTTSRGYAITLDNLNNVITTGQYFANSMDFDPGPGTSLLSGQEAFLHKMTSSGTHVWAKKVISLSGMAYPTSVETNPLNEIYLSGNHSNAIQLSSAPLIQATSNGGQDGFIGHYNSNGDALDVISIGGPSHDQTADLSISPFDDGVHCIGRFQLTADLDPSIGVNNVTSLGSYDLYNLKLGSCNSFEFDIQNVCDSLEWIDGNTYYSSNNTATFTYTNAAGCDSIIQLQLTIYTATVTNDVINGCDSLTWIDGVTYYSSNNTATHMLTNWVGCDSLIQLDLTMNNATLGFDTIIACGSYTWIDGLTYTATTNSPTFILSNAAGCDSTISLDLIINPNSFYTDTIVACDSIVWQDGNSYYASDTTATYNLLSASGCDSIIKLHLTINYSNHVTDTQVACGSYTWINGNTYASNNNTATHTLTNSAGCDSIVYLDLTVLSPVYSTQTITNCGPFTWINGYTYSSSNNSASTILSAANGCDSIINLDLTIIQPSFGVHSIGSCDSVVWIDGQTYFTDNFTATHTLTNAVGCDSIVTLNLTFYNSESYDTIQSCGPYVWIDGNTYNSSTNASFITTNAYGCDSIIHLNLTVNQASSSTDVISSCYSYTWIDGVTYTSDNNSASVMLTNSLGCDSIVYLDLTILQSTSSNDIISSCSAYIWIDGNTYASDNNTASMTYTGVNGCDSIVYLNLTITPLASSTADITSCGPYTWIDGNTYSSSTTATHYLIGSNGCDSIITLNLTVQTIDNTVTLLDPVTLSANAVGVNYQWMDCNNNMIYLGGETNQVFNATSNGTYAVRLTNNNCTIDSDCFNISQLDLQSHFEQNLAIYPNPSNGKITVEAPQDMTCSIYTILGQHIKTTDLSTGSNTLDFNNLTPSTYILKLSSDKFQIIRNLIITP